MQTHRSPLPQRPDFSVDRPTLNGPGVLKEIHLARVSEEGESLMAFMDRIRRELDGRNAVIVSQDVFLPHPETFQPEVEKGIDWPVAWVIEDAPLAPARIRSRVWGMVGGVPHRISVDGRVCGTCFQDEHFRCLRLAGVHGSCPQDNPGEQAASVFKQMEVALGFAGMTFSDVVRTWFYNENILDWYSDFNRVRNDFFRKHRVFEGLVPASTGIGGRNPFGSALSAGLLAVQAKRESSFVRSIPSPLQNSALDYGSSFSRAVEVVSAASKRLMISGTASIGSKGQTLHIGDLEAQIVWTLEVIRAILHSTALDWEHVVRAHAYLRHPAAESVVQKVLKEQGLADLPILLTGQTICRDNLLFEMELEALQSFPPPT